MAEEELGVVFIVLGVVLMIASFFTFFLFVPLCGLGLVLFIVGIVLVATERSRAPAAAYPGYAYPATPPYGFPPPPAGGFPAPQASPGPPACPVCSSPLAWIPQYGRWYCYRCQAYR